MIRILEEYDNLYREYKEFIDKKSLTDTKVAKTNSNSSPFFPFISFQLSNITNTNNTTLDKIESYDNMYLTVNIYTKDVIKTVLVDNEEITKTYSSNVITKDLIELTMQFFNKKNFYMTACRPTPNIDTSIMRTTMQYQASVGNLTRLKTIRR